MRTPVRPSARTRPRAAAARALPGLLLAALLAASPVAGASAAVTAPPVAGPVGHDEQPRHDEQPEHDEHDEHDEHVHEESPEHEATSPTAPEAPGTSPLPLPVPAPGSTAPDRTRTALGALGATASAGEQAAAVPVPVAPVAFATAPEAASRYQGQVSCDPTEKPGAVRLRALLRSTYGRGTTAGITRACSVGGRSDHKEGRAYDWGLNAFSAADREIADTFLGWLVGPDAQGHPAGNARRLGIQYVIWDREIWNASSAVWKPYDGASPHTDHIHLSLSWDGAFARTSFWTGTAVTQVDHGPCQVTDGVLVPPYSGPNYTRCGAAAPPAALPTGRVDEVRPVLDGTVLRGWTRDADTASPLSVHAYVDGGFAGSFTADRPRGDVGPHGFEIPLRLPAGPHQVCLYAINVGSGASNPTLGCPTATRLSTPFGNLEQPTLVPGGMRAAGWAIDPDTNAPVDAHLYVDGRPAAATTASGSRPDVAAAFGRGDAHGFAVTLPLGAGPHDVCAYGINTGPGDANPLLGCRRTVSPGSTPLGSLDAVDGATGSVQVRGWALDPDVTTGVAVHVYVDGTSRAAVPASSVRGDVGAAYPAFGASRGFSATVGGLARGQHQVCAYAVNAGPGSTNPLLGCRSVTTG